MAGIIKSSSDVTLSVLAIPITGIPAFVASVIACENLGYTLGKEISLGVDFASSTQWNEEKHLYVYERAGFENTPEEQIEFAASIIEKSNYF